MRKLSLLALFLALQAFAQCERCPTPEKKANDARIGQIASIALFTFGAITVGSDADHPATFAAFLAGTGGAFIGFTIALDHHRRKTPKPL